MLFLLPVALTVSPFMTAKTEPLSRLVPAGRNEGEGMYFISMNLNGDIVSAFDFGTKKFVEINLNEYATPGYQPTFTSLTDNNKTPIGAIRIGDRLLSTGVYTQGRYCISQASGADTYSVSYPACADPTLTDTLKSAFYACNTLAVKPTLERLACANMQTGCLDICEINGNELIRVNEVHLTPAKVKFNRHRPKGRGLVHPVNYSKYHIFGFCDLAVSDDYIYALYSGRTLKQHNLDVDQRQNHTGIRLERFARAYLPPGKCLFFVSYSAEENTIYALSQENNHSEIITLHL